MAGEACGMCQQPASQRCSGCQAVFYCSRDHQRQHWRVHKASCHVKPYKTSRSPMLGRFLVATRDLKAGDIVMKERPVVVGPKTISKPLCLGCSRIITSTTTCKGCNWPVCGSQCEKSANHIDECKIMAERGYKVTINDFTKKNVAYCCITPMRTLLLKGKDKTKWDAVNKLESHLEKRKNTPIYSVLKTNIVGFFNEFEELRQFDEETILRICGILDTNCFEVGRRDDSIRMRGLYPLASLMAHDCTPNTKHVFDEDDFTITVTATTNIKEGEILSTTYTHILWETTSRRAHLKSAKYFDCSCKRCSDPTELGTYIGSILCSKCKSNNKMSSSKLVSTNPLNDQAPWMCETCSYKVEAKEIEMFNNDFRKEITNLDKSIPISLEHFLEKYNDILHGKNSHVLEIKYALTQMYGKKRGFSLPEMSDSQLQRKAMLCEELIEIAAVIDLGFSYIRDGLQSERQAAMEELATRGMKHRKISNNEQRTNNQHNVHLR